MRLAAPPVLLVLALLACALFAAPVGAWWEKRAIQMVERAKWWRRR